MGAETPAGSFRFFSQPGVGSDKLRATLMLELAKPIPVVPASSSSALPGRLLSLDVFRGATIAAMMLVNNPGDWGAVYAPLRHAPWHGWTFTDLVFPFFLWIVGVALPLATARRLESGQSPHDLLRHAVRRTVIIFALGFFLNSFSFLINVSLWREGAGAWLSHYCTHVRIPGVLQRIAVCYFFASTIFLYCRLSGQALAIGVLLAAYWAAMMLVPVPGFGAGVLEPEGNLSQYIDNLVLNGSVIGTHVWSGTKTWDPEGIFSTLPAIATCLFGVMTGHVLRSKQTPEGKTAWIMVGGSLLLLAGQVMDIWLPINKNLWTSSYSVFMAGMAMVCFGVCYWFLDVLGWRKGSLPFAVYGMNAITVFVLAGVLGRLSLEIKIPAQAGPPVALKTWLYEHLFTWIPDPEVASLGWALMFVLLLYTVAHWMYQRKWFIKF